MGIRLNPFRVTIKSPLLGVVVNSIKRILVSMRFFRAGIMEVETLKVYLLSLPSFLQWYSKRNSDYSVGLGASKSEETLHIFFVARRPRIRELKLAHAARLCGHRVTLISAERLADDILKKFYDGYFQAKSPWRVLDLIKLYRPDAVHLFVGYDILYMVPVVLWSPVPVVYDPYDCMRGMIKREYQMSFLRLKMEKICFERAAHICSRSVEPKLLKRRFGYRIPRITFFPEYCWKQPRPLNENWLGKNGEIHVVYCGQVIPENIAQAKMSGFAQYIQICRILAAQKAHLHIYPTFYKGSDFENYFSLYLEEDQINPYFHFHRSVPHDVLIRELTQYQAALHVLGPRVNTIIGAVTQEKVNYSTANKLFDYIEAGLPVIIHRGRHQLGIVRHYGKEILVDDLKKIRKDIIAAWQRPNRSVRTCNLDFHAPRLGKMYRSLVKKDEFA
jgi:hypothetical protein